MCTAATAATGGDYAHPGPKPARKNKRFRRPNRELDEKERYWLKKSHCCSDKVWWHEGPPPCLGIWASESYFYYAFAGLGGDVHYKVLFYLNYKVPLIPPVPVPSLFRRSSFWSQELAFMLTTCKNLGGYVPFAYSDIKRFGHYWVTFDESYF